MTLEIKTNSGMAPEDMKHIPENVYELELIDRNDPALFPAFREPGAPPDAETKMQLRVRLDFQIVEHKPRPGAEDLTGQRVGDMFTVSLHEKSRLRPFVRSMRGGNDDFDGNSFDLDTLIASKNGAGRGGRLRATVRRKANGYNEVVNPLVSDTHDYDADILLGDVDTSTAGAAAGIGEPPF